MIEIKVPPFGESIQEVQVASWLKKPGDAVARDEEIVELESEKASQALVSDYAGVMGEIKVAAGEFAKVGDVLCLLDDSAPASDAKTTSAESKAQQGSSATQSSSPANATGVADAESSSAEWIMPAAERILSEYQISADAIKPTGPGGRLLKEDVLNYIQQKGLRPPTATQATVPSSPPPTADQARSSNGSNQSDSQPGNRPAPQPVANRPASGGDEPSAPAWGTSGGAVHREEKAVPLSMIRRTIAKRLVEAQQTAALLTTFNEIDMQPVKELRARYKDPFLQKHGVKLGFMSFFAKAAVEGLRRYPAINSEIRDNNVIMKNYHDIGIAIGGGKGLVVPILRNVERMSFADVERTIEHFAVQAQGNKVSPDDLVGGTFTISNGGVYGSLLSTPIVNPPQSGILGLHSIQDRPVAIAGQVVIRPMMYVALTYDHRIVDGKEAVGFLKTIKEVLEEPARLFLEV